MNSTALIVARRGSLVFRVAALLLLLLTALPFTAPFATCDDAVFTFHDAGSVDHGADKDSDSAVCWSGVPTEALPASCSPTLVRMILGYTGTPGPALYVLRL